jgi:hypothetical protein
MVAAAKPLQPFLCLFFQYFTMNLYKKVIIISAFSILIAIAISELILRQIGFQPAHVDETNNVLAIEPDSFLVKDNYVGWRLGKGCFTTLLNDSAVFKHCTDSFGNRNIPYINTFNETEKRDILHLYGCSYTFGYSVSDTSNLAYYLQQLMPDTKVINKGVPGYGLLQMFLCLKKQVENGNKPNIAVFNYASFQNYRTPINKEWIRAFKYAAIQSGGEHNFRIDYPYATLNSNNGIDIKKMKWEDLPKDYPLRDKLAIVNALNTFVDRISFNNQKETFDITTYKVAFEIANLCKKNNIKLIFAFFNDEDKIKLRFTDKDVITLSYNVNISDPEYNCSPIDPSHPNAKAHKIFAYKIYSLLNDTL